MAAPLCLEIRLSSVKPGEYGFLPPGVSSASISSNGKIFTFGVVEDHRQTPPNLPPQERDSDHAAPASEISDFRAKAEGSIGASSDGNPNVLMMASTLSRITSGGPADQVGIKAGDVILAIGDHYVVTIEELSKEVRRQKPGTRIAIRYRRHSTIYDTYVIVGRSD